MNKELRELLNKISDTKNKAKDAYNAGNVEEGDRLKDEAVSLQAQADGLIALDGIGSNAPVTSADQGNGEQLPPQEPQARSSMEIIQAFMRGDRTSPDVVRNISTVEDPDNPNGVTLIIPEDISNEIRELRRSYRAARDLIGYYETTTLSGSYPVEDTSTLGDLVDFEDGDEITQSEDPKFKQIKYKITMRGSFLPISNLLRQVAPSGFISYISRWWNKKAIQTENKKIFAALVKDKTAKTIKGLSGLKSTINKDLDPAFTQIQIVTNQDGWDYLDNLTDANGRPLLQPDPMQKDRYLFKGTYPITYFANRLLPSTGAKAPIFIGDLVEGVDFIELNGGLQMATSDHADFKKNRTLMRLVTGYDVQQKDKDAYVYGLLDTSVAEPASVK